MGERETSGNENLNFTEKQSLALRVTAIIPNTRTNEIANRNSRVHEININVK